MAPTVPTPRLPSSTVADLTHSLPGQTHPSDVVHTLLETLDLSPLTARLCHQLHVPPSGVEDLMREYRRFLVLKYTQSDTQSVHTRVWCPPMLQCIWGLHVLDTRQYRCMCEAIGVGIDFGPPDVCDDDEGSRQLNAAPSMRATYTCYKNHFDEDPPLPIWSDAPRSMVARLLHSAVTASGPAAHRSSSSDVAHSAAAEETPGRNGPAEPPTAATASPPGAIRIHFGVLCAHPQGIQPTCTFTVLPTTRVSKILQAHAQRVQAAFPKTSPVDLAWIKTEVVDMCPSYHDGVLHKAASHGGTWMHASDPWWHELTVGEVGFKDHEHVLAVHSSCGANANPTPNGVVR